MFGRRLEYTDYHSEGMESLLDIRGQNSFQLTGLRIRRAVEETGCYPARIFDAALQFGAPQEDQLYPYASSEVYFESQDRFR
jgi:hypothetical protein